MSVTSIEANWGQVGMRSPQGCVRSITFTRTTSAKQIEGGGRPSTLDQMLRTPCRTQDPACGSQTHTLDRNAHSGSWEDRVELRGALAVPLDARLAGPLQLRQVGSPVDEKREQRRGRGDRHVGLASAALH